MGGLPGAADEQRRTTAAPGIAERMPLAWAGSCLHSRAQRGDDERRPFGAYKAR